MARCKFCGASIDWILSREEGRYIPVNEEPVFVALDGGDERFITDEGEYLTGRLDAQDGPPAGRDVAFIIHRCLGQR